MSSSGRGYKLKAILYIAAYVLPSAIVWGILGIVLWPLNNIPLLMPLVALVYALLFGLLETLGLPFRALGLAWQVPSGWINGRSAIMRALTWGSLLGPGFVTRNPYAGMWLLPLLVVFNHSLPVAAIAGMAVGGVHGGARALGVLSNGRHMVMEMDTEFAEFRILGAQMRWQYVDGLILLLAAGALAAYILSQFI